VEHWKFVSDVCNLPKVALTFAAGELFSSPTAAPGANVETLDQPLLPNASFALNYGNGGGEPLRFLVEEDYPCDVGFLRVFLSNKPFDLDIEQDGLDLIAEGREMPTRGKRGGRLPTDTWDVLTLPIIQKNPRFNATHD